ncbi:MAG: DUF4160 domain-containing protein [Clostridia bacterium]|nr:DUF4160 domain-containing protein [Clostridia bacterium]MBQ7574305.1 DUF4160 domain-containing protein [Clostridia bacterium]
MSELQIHYQIIFNNFKERYISDDPGIVSSLLADLRNEDMDIARKTFSQYARGDFVFSYNYCTTLHDLYVEIYNHLGFETEINNRGIMNPVYIYEKLLYIRIQPSSHKLVDLIKDFSIGKDLNIYLEFCSTAGNCFKNNEYDELRFFMHSNERCGHNRPHVHVECGETNASIDLFTFKMIGDLPYKLYRKAVDVIKLRRKDLLVYWNYHTNGLDVDIDMAIKEERLVIAQK